MFWKSFELTNNSKGPSHACCWGFVRSILYGSWGEHSGTTTLFLYSGWNFKCSVWYTVHLLCVHILCACSAIYHIRCPPVSAINILDYAILCITRLVNKMWWFESAWPMGGGTTGKCGLVGRVGFEVLCLSSAQDRRDPPPGFLQKIISPDCLWVNM